MKHRLYAFILTLSLAFIFSGCVAAENPVEAVINNTSENLNETESETIAETTETTETTEAEVTSLVPATTETEQTTISQQTSNSDTTTPPQTSRRSITIETSINTTQDNKSIITYEEAYDIAFNKINELNKLFIDYLQYNAHNIVFTYDKDNNSVSGMYETEDGNDFEFYFLKVYHDTIKTYNDLYTIFNKTCTPEYSTYLLKFFSHQYTDINGELYFNDTILCQGPINSSEGSKLISFDFDNKSMKLDFSVSFDLFCGEKYEPANIIYYSINLIFLDDEWFISDCSDMNYHGYNWMPYYIK